MGAVGVRIENGVLFTVPGVDVYFTLYCSLLTDAGNAHVKILATFPKNHLAIF